MKWEDTIITGKFKGKMIGELRILDLHNAGLDTPDDKLSKQLNRLMLWKNENNNPNLQEKV